MRKGAIANASGALIIVNILAPLYLRTYKGAIKSVSISISISIIIMTTSASENNHF